MTEKVTDAATCAVEEVGDASVAISAEDFAASAPNNAKSRPISTPLKVTSIGTLHPNTPNTNVCRNSTGLCSLSLLPLP